MRVFRLAPLLLAACVTAAPRSAPAPSERVAAECALLARAGAAMAAVGTSAHAGLREGCPGETAVDSRPLARQTASLRAAGAAALPPGVPAGGRAEAVFRRMITRGVPVPVAVRLTADPLFAAAVR